MRRGEDDAIAGEREDETDFALSLRLLRLPDWALWQVVRSLNWPQAREVIDRWSLFAHPGQFRPTGDWRIWLIRAGRGFGKTRAGAEWVCEIARDVPKARIALVGASMEDAVKVMVRGPSGVLAVARPDQKAEFRAAGNIVEFAGGATAHLYSAEAPEKLRGPEHNAAWCDELAKWRFGDAAWDNLMLGLRLTAGAGDQPRCVVTTTPKTNPLTRKVMALKGLAETRGRTTDNPHLPPAYVAAMLDTYGGTRLGRQELNGELVDDLDGALFLRDWFEAGRVAVAPHLVRVVVGVDPPASATGDACGIVACGIDADGVGYVLGDASVAGLSPEGWARAVADCAALHGADRVVAEKNNGGDMVRSVLAAADAGLPVKLVHASRGKVARAEPIAAKYERGEVRHVGAFEALEDELAGLQVAGGYTGPGGSPDRADACVWALTELMLGRRGPARVRGLGV